jgi:hypothetical protein
MLVANIFLPDRLKRYPTRLTTLFTLVGALFHANILAGIDMDFLGMLHADAPSTHCKVQAYILQFLAISMLVLWCLICDSLHAILVRQMSPEELDAYERPYLAAWLSVASALTVAPFAIAQPLPQFGAPYCWISHDNMMEWQILFFEVPSLLALLFGVVISKQKCIDSLELSILLAPLGARCANPYLGLPPKHRGGPHFKRRPARLYGPAAGLLAAVFRFQPWHRLVCRLHRFVPQGE